MQGLGNGTEERPLGGVGHAAAAAAAFAAVPRGLYIQIVMLYPVKRQTLPKRVSCSLGRKYVRIWE